MKRDRLYELIKCLSQSSEWVSATVLAEKLHTTTRTIRNYVKQINDSAENQMFIIGSQDGYKWQGGTGDILDIYNNDVPNTNNERVRYLVKQLAYADTITNRRILSIENLCNKLFISENTLMQDIDETRKILKRYAINVHINKGILSLSGKESDIRRLIHGRIYDYKKNPILSFNYLVYAFPDLDIEYLFNTVSLILFNHNLEADGYHIYNLLLYIIIQLKRIKEKHLISSDEITIPDLNKYPDYEAAKTLSEIFKEKFDVSYTWWEMNYLTMLLISLCHYRAKPFSFYTKEEEEVRTIIRHLRTHDLIVLDEEKMINELTHFLCRTLIRNTYQISVVSPFENTLKNDSIATYDTAAWILAQFTEKAKVSVHQSDLIYLTLLLERNLNNKEVFIKPVKTILICPDFFGTTSDILKKLKLYFSDQIEIEHVIRTYDIEDLPEAQMVISLLPSLKLKNFVMISPSFKPEDIFNIQQKLLQIRKEQMIRNISYYISENTADCLFETEHYFADRKDAMDYISTMLLEKGCIDKTFAKQIKMREQIDGSGYHGIIAIPHASLKTIEKDLIYIILNKNPMSWGHSEVNIIFYIVSRRDHSKKMLRFCNDIVRLFEDPKVSKKILSSKDYSSFVSCIQDFDK